MHGSQHSVRCFLLYGLQANCIPQEALLPGAPGTSVESPPPQPLDWSGLRGYALCPAGRLQGQAAWVALEADWWPQRFYCPAPGCLLELVLLEGVDLVGLTVS